MKNNFYVAKCINPLKEDKCLYPSALVLVNSNIIVINNIEYVHVAKYEPDGYCISLNLGLRRKDRFEKVEYDLSSIKEEDLVQISNSDLDICQYHMINERMKDIKENFFEPEKSLSEMSTEELRAYITIFSEYGYNSYCEPLIPFKMSYERQKEIIIMLNTEFNKRIPNKVLAFYNKLDNIHNEKWCGDERYKLLSFTCGLSTEKCILNTAIKLSQLDFSNIENVVSVIDYGKFLPYKGDILNVDDILLK